MKKVVNYLIISRLLIFISFSSLIIGQTVFNPIVIDNTVVGSKSVFAADMDGDGDMDIVSSSDDWNTGKIKWHENDGSADPTLTSENIQAFSGIGIVAVFAADMDGDGDMDIVSASEIPGTIGWSENDGAVDPTWSSRSSIANVSNVESVFAADMDGDGDMDILTTSWYNSKLDWYENDGATDPTWSKANIGSGGGPKSVFAADMDGDGDMDIAAAFAENNSIAWYENDGATDPTWTVAVIATNAEWASSVYVADMDGDGDMDIVSGSEDDDTIAWYENDGATDPTFAAVDVFKSDDYVSPISVSAADMDGDGDMDIVTISSFTLSWFANDGATDPTWTGTDILDEYGFRSIFLADMDKDGDTDIVSSTSSKISWFEAILPPDEISFLSLTDVTIKEDEIYSVTFISKSDDGNSIAFSAESDNNSVTASISSSTLTVTPTANWYGVANIKVSASVGSTTEEVSFKLTVTAVSDISTVQDVTIDEDKVAEVDLISTFSGTTTFTAVSDTNAVTASISSSTLTLTPNANWNNDGSSLYFNGNAGFRSPVLKSRTFNPINYSDWTFEMWYKPGFTVGQGNLGHLLYWNEGCCDSYIKYLSDGRLMYRVGSSTVTSTDTYTNQQWYYISVVRDRTNNEIRMYVDGILIGTNIDSDLRKNQHFTVGYGGNAGDIKFEQPGEFYLSMLVVSDSVMYSGSNHALPIDLPTTSATIAAYTFTEGSGSSVTDVINGTYNSTWSKNLSWVAEAPVNIPAVITAFASDGTTSDSTSFKLTVTGVNDAPTAFEWVSSVLDTVNITQENLDVTYTLQWDASTDAADGDAINYLLYAKIGVNPPEEIYDTTSTSVSITYEEFVENVFEPFPMLPGATVKFSVVATDGIDTVKVTGDDRVVYVNRYDYLSIAAEGIPLEFALHDNYPNPFNPTTTLRFDLPEVSDITLTIYNMLGQKVRTFDYQNTSAGYHSITWDATNDLGQQVGAGVYLYQLQTKNFVKTRKMVLLK